MNTVAKDFADRYNDYTNVFQHLVGWVRDYGPDFLVNTVAALIVFGIGWLVAHYVGQSVRRALRRRALHEKLRVRMLYSLGLAAWWMFVVFVAFRCYDVNLVPALAGLGVAGIVVGFAFQESLSSLAAGAMMSFSDPFKVGDEVTIAGYNGVVKSFGYTSTVIRLWDARLVTIPNKQVWGAQIVNHSRERIRRVDRTVGIAYAADVPKALEVLRAAIATVPGVLRDPAPQAWCTGLADSSVTITVWPWVKPADWWPVWEKSYPVLKKALEDNGIQIPFPQLDVHLDGERKSAADPARA